ncbi:phosphate ABC transporter permease PstA [Paenactinomyces guangxiensis]|uniref:Phosphate transport system permease protein PstA n=1 Tax=Paenactinomyces guangxiensis TaxID=1490290 RepID=A0A7W2A9R2_9BACL|nr:phosphate ABC transporter permease PstA [Paenactinomyces guangxiensis]MBA4495514.1 phosphate ABC transporter permease PstA [Paenactinomyces guangxiensis]MBH8592772.1 phosphate ABC transporter permease PstA [Paenactinomyces guangxiensis]
MPAEETLVSEKTVPRSSVAVKRDPGSSRVGFRRIKNKTAHVLFLLATLIGVLVLAVLLFDIVQRGWPYLTSDFFNNFASRIPSRAGIHAAFWGSVWMIAVTAPLTFLIGVAAAVYLEEYSKKGWLSRLIQLNIANLAGVPSIVFGILGLTLFVRGLELGKSVLAGSLTMTLLVLPVVIVAAREAIASVPDSLRQASYAMGATRWQTIRNVVLPYAFPGILTGTILALSRAIGETAPLIMVGAVTFLAFTPASVFDEFTVMPIQIYRWIAEPKEEFQYLASAGIIVLLAILLSMNALAIYLRNKFQR